MLDRILNELRKGPTPAEAIAAVAIGTKFEHAPTDELVETFGKDAILKRKLILAGCGDLESTIAQDLGQ